MRDECVLMDCAVDITARYVAADLHTRDSSILMYSAHVQHSVLSVTDTHDIK